MENKKEVQRGPQQRTRAAAKDILGGFIRPENKRQNGFVPGRSQVDPKWAEHYQNLLTLREQYFDRKSHLTQDAREETPVFSLHMADAATDSYDRDMALSMISSEQSALYEIEEALKRIENGVYGICELTGSTIEPDRLLAIPWTRFSADAKKQLEKDGVNEKVSLGQLGSFVEQADTEEPTEEED